MPSGTSAKVSDTFFSWLKYTLVRVNFPDTFPGLQFRRVLGDAVRAERELARQLKQLPRFSHTAGFPHGFGGQAITAAEPTGLAGGLLLAPGPWSAPLAGRFCPSACADECPDLSVAQTPTRPTSSVY